MCRFQDPYTLAVTLNGVLMRYAFLRRGLSGETGMARVLTPASAIAAARGAANASSGACIVYSAADVSWDDGCTLIRHLLQRPSAEGQGSMPSFIQASAQNAASHLP